MISILGDFAPHLDTLTYHYSDYLLLGDSSDRIIPSSGVDVSATNAWGKFRNLSILCLTNVIGTELTGILKLVGVQLRQLTINNLGLWECFNSRRPGRLQDTAHRTSHNGEERINLFELASLTPNLYSLSLEMGHYVFRKGEEMVRSNTRSTNRSKCDGKHDRVYTSSFLGSLKVLHIKGINHTSSKAVKELLCLCLYLEELVLLTKPIISGNHRLKFSPDNEYDLCNIINENMLQKILRRNQLQFLRIFIASTINPCPSGCKLQLTENR